MFLGISTYTFPWAIEAAISVSEKILALKKILQFAEDNDIHYLQICDNIPLHKFSAEEITDIKNKAIRSGIHLQVGTRRLEKENVLRYLVIAKNLSSPFLRIVIDDTDFHPSEQQVIDSINNLLPHLRENKLILAIENHDRFPAEVLKNIISKTDPSCVGICLDTANSLGAGEGINQVVNILAPYTINLHIKDFDIKRVQHKMGFVVEGTAAGDGMLNIPWIIAELNKTKRCETATLEVWSNGEIDFKTSIDKEKVWVDRSINYLKKMI